MQHTHIKRNRNTFGYPFSLLMLSHNVIIELQNTKPLMSYHSAIRERVSITKSRILFKITTIP